MAEKNTIDFRKLAEPFPKSELRSFTGKGGKKFDYITARHVMNRLDSVVGPENWRDEYREVGEGGVVCTLYLRINGEWVGKSDVGTREGNVEPVKGKYSVALKRAAVHWGIGRELYDDGTAFDDDDHPPAPNPRRIPETPAAPEPPASELDVHLGPRKPRGGKPAPSSLDARAKDLARRTCPWDGAMQREIWQDFIQKYPEWPKKFWPAAKALGMDNDMVHTALGVESVTDWTGADGKNTVAHLWYALVYAAVESDLIEDAA